MTEQGSAAQAACGTPGGHRSSSRKSYSNNSFHIFEAILQLLW